MVPSSSLLLLVDGHLLELLLHGQAVRDPREVGRLRRLLRHVRWIDALFHLFAARVTLPVADLSTTGASAVLLAVVLVTLR